MLQIAAGDAVFVIDLFAFPDPAAALAALFEALARVEVVGHNLQFDLRFLAQLGFVPRRLFDTMLASRVLHAGDREDTGSRLGHKLGDVAARELARSPNKAEQKSDWSRPTLSPEQLRYAARDAAVLLPLAESLKAKLAAAGLTAAAELEMRALPGVAWVGPVGVDVAAWSAIATAAAAEVSRLCEEMTALAPNPNDLFDGRNWNSAEQVKQAFAGLGFTLASTEDAALAGIDHPLAGLLRDYRSTGMRAGTYGKAWLGEHVGPGARVLPSWNQLGAESGRMSCSDPNWQRVPRGSDYRKCFTAAPGCVLVKADYSQVELRIAAKVANEAVMIAAYRDGGDRHRLTAARVLGKDELAVTKADRQIAKSLNFGLLFGMGWKGLREYAQANYRVVLADEQAKGYRDAFFKAYPGLRQWHDRTRAGVKKRFDADPTGAHDVRTLAGRPDSSAGRPPAPTRSGRPAPSAGPTTAPGCGGRRNR